MSTSVHQVEEESPDTNFKSGSLSELNSLKSSIIAFFFLDQTQNPDKSQKKTPNRP